MGLLRARLKSDIAMLQVCKDAAVHTHVFFLKYEDLLSNQQTVLQQLFAFMGAPAEETSKFLESFQAPLEKNTPDDLRKTVLNYSEMMRATLTVYLDHLSSME
jgi:hypothetical protein